MADRPKKSKLTKTKDKIKVSKDKPSKTKIEGDVVVIPVEEYQKLTEALATQAQLLAIATNMNIELTKKVASFSPVSAKSLVGSDSGPAITPVIGIAPVQIVDTPQRPTGRPSPPQPTDYVVSLALKLESHSSTPAPDDWWNLMSTKGIMHHTVNIGWSKMSEEQFLYIPQFCINLKTLVIPNCDAATDAFLIQVAKKCPKLKTLDIRYGKNITSYSLKTCANNFPALKHLQIDQMKDIKRKQLEALFTSKPNLQFFSACSTKGDDTGSGNTHLLDDYSSGYAKLALCTKMERLFLEGSGISNVTMSNIFKSIGGSLIELRIPGNKVSDVTLKVIGGYCTKLEVLDIGHAYDVTAPGIEALTNIQTLQELVIHYIKNDNKADAEERFGLITKFQNLRSLNIQGWSHITTDQLWHFLSAMPKMEMICTAMSSCTLQGDMVYGNYTNVPNWLAKYKPQRGG